MTPEPYDPAERRPDPGPGPDPGLARARTSLAWIRTALAFAAVGGAELKRGAELKKEVIPGLVIMALGLVVWRLGQLPHHLPGRLKLVTVTIVAVAVAALVLTLTS